MPSPNHYSSGLPRKFSIIIWISLFMVYLLSTLDLIGWAFNISIFKSIAPQWEPMKINSALCFIFAATALLIMHSDLPAIIRKGLVTFFTIFIFGTSLITIYGYYISLSSSHESSMTGLSALFLSHGMRMAFLTAFNFLLIASILFLLLAERNKATGLANIITITVLLVSYYIIVSYILGVETAFKMGDVQIALNTGIAFLGIGIAALIIRPHTLLLKLFDQDNTGGIISRKLLPPLILLPIVVGWLRILGERTGIFESEKGIVFVAVIYAVCFLIIIFLTAISINKIDAKRRTSEEALLESREQLSAVFNGVSEILMLIDIEGNIIAANNTANIRFNQGLPGFEGKSIYDFIPVNFHIKRKEQVSELVLTKKPVKFQDKLRDEVFDMTFYPVFDLHGNVIQYISLATDITERKKAENSLLYQAKMLEAIKDAVIGSDLSLNINFWNKAAEKIYGWKAEEVMGKSSKDVIRSEMTQDQREAIRKDLIEGKPSYTELVQYTKDDKPLLIEGYTFPLKNSDGIITSIVAINSDITEKKKAENIIRNGEQRLKYHLENSPLAVVEWNEKFNVVQWSNEAERIFGLNKKEVLGARIDSLNIIYEEDIPIVEKTMERLISGKELKVVSRNRNYTKNREIIECVWYNSVLLDENGKMSSVMSLVENITLLKKTEKELTESKEVYEELVTNARSIIVKLDTKGNFTFANEFAVTFFGYTEEELIGKSVIGTIVPQIDSGGRNLEEMVEDISGDPDKYSININENITKNGERVWIEWYNKAIFDKNGIRTGHIAIGIDITERAKAEEKLKESENRFRTISESLPVLILINRIRESIVSYVNEPYEKAFGFKKGEMTGKKVHDIFYYPHDRARIDTTLQEKGGIYNTEIKVKKADGTPFWIMTSIRKIMFMNEPSYLTASIDITETKKAEEELLRLNHTLDAHSKSSQAMMHSYNELQYIKEVCRIIIEDCGHSMVWIGYAQNDDLKSVKPMAYYGFDQGYINHMNITWDDTPQGRGPTGTAIRTGKPSVCKNMLTDPNFEPWREGAIERGYASSLVLPLMIDGKPFGAISIYSKEPESFSDTEIELLSDLADDLAYGISYIRLQESERNAARVIKENEAELKELVATKDKFFNIVAHDLKNPFTSLLGSSELLYDNIDQMTTENIKRLAIILNDSAKGGYSILQNLLDWSRSQTGLLKIIPARINLRTIIDENIKNLNLPASNKKISLKSELEENLFIVTDRNMINTVLRNLLSNAIKFTFKNGNVIVRVDQTPQEVTITVKDTGIGISKEIAVLLFRIDNSVSITGTDKEQGTGLGLKLCKEFVDKLGGRIWVESTENKGSEFKFSIPIKEG